MTYTILRQIPAVETYRRLRIGSGLSAKTIEAAERGLPRSQTAPDSVGMVLKRQLRGRGLQDAAM